jgi:hypothetical protein
MRKVSQLSSGQRAVLLLCEIYEYTAEEVGAMLQVPPGAIEQALLPVILGALVGIASCAAISRIFSSLLFGVSPLDSISFVVVPLFLLGVAAIASCIPAWKATRVDPLLALRYE